MSEHSAVIWDEAAATFDLAPDHGLTDPHVRAAWSELLRRTLPPPPARIADLGCVTGTIAILAAELGHQVDGVDFSEQMLLMARAKSEKVAGVTFTRGDAARPNLTEHSYDAVVSRHVLWALPDPAGALTAWGRLLRLRGRLILIEGRWSTGAGLPGSQTTELLTDGGFTPTIRPLDDPQYWGGPIDDERYLVTAEAVAKP